MEKENDHIDLKKAYEAQSLILERKESKIESLEFELKQLKKLFYLGKRERFVASGKGEEAPTLFDVPLIEELKPSQVKIISYEKQSTKKQAAKHLGRNGFPESLRREEIIINPTDINLSFAKKIGEDITEVLSYVPAELFVKRVVRPKYQDVSTGIIHQQSAPSRGFERSKVDTTIPAQLLVSKYVDHLPLDRQIKMFARLGLTISDSSVNNWINAAGYFLTPLYEKHKELVLNTDYLHADETTIRVMDTDKKGSTHQGYYWVYQSHENKLVLFEYQKGRGREGPREMLKYFKGYLQTDGYQVYEEFGKKEGIVLIHCMAHARRKFVEALPNDKTRAEYILGEIQKLYAIERHIQEAAFSEDQKQAYRIANAKPILIALKQWMLTAYQEVLPSSIIAKALHYSLQRWDRLSLYADTSVSSPKNSTF
jgi:transposase